MMAVEFSQLVQHARRRSDGPWWDSRCPAHDDRRESLSFRDGDHALVVQCHAGCTREAIAQSVGRTVGDFNHEPRQAGRGGARRQIVATYDYTDAAGTALYQIVRCAPKHFFVRRPDGRGGWINGLGDIPRVVYRLAELRGTPRVYWTEGEKDADRLAGLGLTSTTSPGGANAFRDAYAQQLADLGVGEVVICPDHDDPGRAYAQRVAAALTHVGVTARLCVLPDLRPKGDVSDWLDTGGSREALEALADGAPVYAPDDVRREPEPAPTADSAPTVSAQRETPPGDGMAEPALRREGFDLSLAWTDGVTFALTAVHDSRREGVRGELTVCHRGQRLSWGTLGLSSTAARESLRKKLAATAPGIPWSDRLETAAFLLTQAVRQGEPLVALTGAPTASPTRELLPRLLFEGESTVVFGDGDSGKSLFALAVAVATHAGVGLPFGLKPARAATAAFLDWETSRETVEERLALLAAGLGVDPPPILYKRMFRPLVDEAAVLAAEFARRDVGLVVIDSKMFAVAGGEGAAFHEPITAFYAALRLFAPAASLVLNHVTNDAAKSGAPARPFGGAFAFNSPRMVWEVKRDHDAEDATTMVFTCRKANNLPRKPDPFGLRFTPAPGTITVYPLDLAEAAPHTVAGASLPYRARLLLAHDSLTTPEVAKALGISEASARTILRRLHGKGAIADLGTDPDGKAKRWGPRNP